MNRDIAGYIWQADTYCEACALPVLEAAEAAGVDVYANDLDEFPKAILESDEGLFSCGGCGRLLATRGTGAPRRSPCEAGT